MAIVWQVNTRATLVYAKDGLEGNSLGRLGSHSPEDDEWHFVVVSFYY
jgi:hypothetical protein